MNSILKPNYFRRVGPRKKTPRRALGLTLLAVLLIGGAVRSAAQTQAVDEYTLKASFLTLFPQYTSWPSNMLTGSNAPVVIGVLGSDPFGPVLDQTALGQKGGPPLTVKRITTLEEAAQCYVVFIAKTESRNEAAWLAALKDMPVLTVGESGQTIARGGAVEFKTEDKRIRFEINLPAVETAKLKISSLMLAHASKVYRSAKSFP